MAGFRSILITGASSGIGAALAEEFAAPGVCLALVARNAERLDAVAARCQAKGAQTDVATIDVADTEALRAFVQRIDTAAPLDLVVANAAISTGMQTGAGRESTHAARAVLNANTIGMLNTIEPAIDVMLPRGRGHIAITGSIAAYLGLPYSPSYCASKAAVHTYAGAYRAALGPRGIKVSLIIPGFVETPLSDSLTGPRPLMVSPQKAAIIIRCGLERGADIIPFPRVFRWFMWVVRLMPTRLVNAVLNRVEVEVPELEPRR